MNYYSYDTAALLKKLNVDKRTGLSVRQAEANAKAYGKNLLKKKKKKNLFQKIIDCLLEPMILILLISWVITLGINLGKFFKTGEADFVECIGILAAVVLSVTITLVMEGTSERAFEALSSIYENLKIKVIRGGKTLLLNQSDVTVGDIVVLSSGDKIVADGRLIEDANLSVDESTLTGESKPRKKSAEKVLPEGTPLAERINCVYSGTFVTSGRGLMAVTAIGNDTEIGLIAGELDKEKEVRSPLQQKLGKLGKFITVIGVVASAIVFILSAVRLFMTGNLNFANLQSLFVTCIVLIVAAVPEGLPTIVAISLALNMIKLAGENALIKKMIATETAGAVSVICSDKTGTITENKMVVQTICTSEFCYLPEKLKKDVILQNICINSTADLIEGDSGTVFSGSATECALLVAYGKGEKKDYRALRDKYDIVLVEPFSSETKQMKTAVRYGGKKRVFLKGAPEKVLEACDLSPQQKRTVTGKIDGAERQAKRIICFAHKDVNRLDTSDKGFTFDGYATISDPVRKEVAEAVRTCKKAGIKVKILTGDNAVTAAAVAYELKLISSEDEVASASELEKLSDEELRERLKNTVVIARSTPILKLRVVKLLKSMGEVVAVTGDGINDAPAIKHADVGISMGIAGSEITKEASDVILLDDSFSTIVKAVAFGRNVYLNLQRFILFQLSVNLSALLLIIVSLLMGFPSPFNTLQLLWINIIMDGPPALTLGLEAADNGLMRQKPVARNRSIVSFKMLLRIIIHGTFIATVVLLQLKTNFLHVERSEQSSVVFTLFILFQLFNAFNSRELGKRSIFSNLSKNKIMLITFAFTFLAHILIIEISGAFTGGGLSLSSWVKTALTAFLIVGISEGYKLIYRLIHKEEKEGRIFSGKRAEI